MACAIGALVFGWWAGAQPAPTRPGDLTTPVNASWYAALPLDPAAATAAYLARIPPEMRARGERYSDGRMLAFLLEVFSVLAASALLVGTRTLVDVRARAERRLTRRWAVDAIVAAIYFAAMYALVLPAAVYAHYVRPRTFGFADLPFTAWLGDSLVEWAVMTVFFVLGVLAIYRFIRARPATWVVWAAATYVVLRTLYAVLSPDVIEPLTNRFRPLPDGPQKQQIVALAQANGVRDAAVVLSDASRQSRILNAHVSGFAGSTRISLDDTTLARTSDDALRMVVAHEIGHFVLDHMVVGLVVDSLLATSGFALIALCSGALLRRHGAGMQVAGLGDIASLPLFWGLFLLWGFVSLPLANVVWRAEERQADLFGLNASQAPHGMAEFMIHDADVARLEPNRLEYALFYTHPSAAERVATAMTWRAARARLP